MSQVWQRPFIPKSILVDAGPLIAMLNRSDKNHRQIKRFLEEFRGRMLTTWPVLVEACRFSPERTQIRFLRWAAAGGLEMVELHETALAEIADWKEKYRDLPMDLADACGPARRSSPLCSGVHQPPRPFGAGGAKFRRHLPTLSGPFRTRSVGFA